MFPNFAVHTFPSGNTLPKIMSYVKTGKILGTPKSGLDNVTNFLLDGTLQTKTFTCTVH